MKKTAELVRREINPRDSWRASGVPPADWRRDCGESSAGVCCGRRCGKMKKQMQLVRCTVNGKEVEEYVDVQESLLDMLRNRLGLTSVKKAVRWGNAAPVR